MSTIHYLIKRAAGPTAPMPPLALQSWVRSLIGQSVTVQVPRVAAQVKGQWHVFDARTISLFTADTKYTSFHAQGREHIISETLASLEQRLAPHGFLRVHRGTLLNTAHVRGVQREGRRLALVLNDGQVVLASRRLTPAVLRALGIERPTDPALLPVNSDIPKNNLLRVSL